MIKVQVEVPLQLIRKALVLLDAELPSDEVLMEKLGSDVISLNLQPLGPEAAQIQLGMALIVVGQKFENAS